MRSLVTLNPLWARAYSAYNRLVPNHKGKRFFLELIHRIGRLRSQYFVWKMKNGCQVAIPLSEANVAWSVGGRCFLDGEFEEHIQRVLQKLLVPGDQVVDVGANIGYFSALMSELVGPTGSVWAFEPVPPTFQSLQITAQQSSHKNIKPMNVALSEQEQELEITYEKDCLGWASFHSYEGSTPRGASTSKVQTKKLDSFFPDGAVPLKLIKMDVEGHELQVLKGARGVLTRHQPILIFEYNVKAANASGWTMKHIAEELSSLGYPEINRITEDGFVPFDPNAAENHTLYFDLISFPKSPTQKSIYASNF